MADIIKKSVLASLGLLDLTREKVKGAVDKMVERGKVDREHAGSLVEELVKRGEDHTKRIGAHVEKGIAAGFKRAHLVARDEFQKLEERVEKLEKALEELSKK